MDIHQLKTFVTVAREGSITRASDLLFLSQPAVSAHIKAMEDTLGILLFDRTPKGMVLTHGGQRLLVKAEDVLCSHQRFLSEATRIKGVLSGKLRLGVGGHASSEALGRLLCSLSEEYPEVEVVLKHSSSLDIVSGIKAGNLDAGFYNEAGRPSGALSCIEINRFALYLAAPIGMIDSAFPLDWHRLADLPWICPASSTCCGQAAEALFQAHGIRPKRIISIDSEAVTRTLIAGGVGVGLLHESVAREAKAKGDVELICETDDPVRVLFACLSGRTEERLLSEVNAIVSRETSV